MLKNDLLFKNLSNVSKLGTRLFITTDFWPQEIDTKNLFPYGKNLPEMKVFNITLSNRSIEKALYLKNLFNDLKIVEWGQTSDTDMVINATSVGLSENDKLDLNFSKFQNSEFFYDVIYNPKETNFLKSAKKLGKQTENGKKMFIYQAAEAFKIWHGIDPEINKEIEGLLDD